MEDFAGDAAVLWRCLLEKGGKEMSSNVGMIDRALRLLVGLALIVAPMINFMGLGATAATAYTLMAIGGVLILTAVFGVCPIYKLLGLKTTE